MNATPQRFPLAVHTYLWLVFSVLGLLPVALLVARSDRVAVPQLWWATSLAWPFLVVLLFWYGLRRCSSERMSFRDGLLWITWSMMTGWMNMSFVTVAPTVLAAFAGAVNCAIYGDLRRQPTYAPAKWAQIVAFFYRHRMRR